MTICKSNNLYTSVEQRKKKAIKSTKSPNNDNNIPDNAGVAIEFNIPTTSKRIDFILSGRDSKNKDSVIIIELKQWETCTAVEGKDGIVSTYTGGGIREVTHPSYQAMSYANLIKDFNETVQLEDIGLYPCAFLHNYDLSINDPINSEQYQEYIKEAPMFGCNDFEKLRDFIKRYVIYSPLLYPTLFKYFIVLSYSLLLTLLLLFFCS